MNCNNTMVENIHNTEIPSTNANWIELVDEIDRRMQERVQCTASTRLTEMGMVPQEH